MIRKVCMACALTGWFILCTAGCGAWENLDVEPLETNIGNENGAERRTESGQPNHEAERRTEGTQPEEGIAAQTESIRHGNGETSGNTESARADRETGTEAATEPENVLDYTLEEMLSWEVESNQGVEYLVITGVAEKYREIFEAYLAEMDKQSFGVCLDIPEEIGGITVREIGAEAFAGIKIPDVEFPDTVTVIGDGAFRNTGLCDLYLPSGLESIGAEAFANCCLQRIEFPDIPIRVGERGFAGNKDLWTVLVPDVETRFGEDVFADCSGQFLLCYGDDPEGRENLVAQYAKENGLDSMEIVLSREPIVHYYDDPLVLRPRVANFFYGEDGDEETEQWCSWEYNENAPNFGYEDWQWPGCSSWCGAMYFEQGAEATSELASQNGRYSAENVLGQSRMSAWAEGAEGYGIGESITYRQTYAGLIDNKWEAMGPEYREPAVDGFIRYTEICIVNGYAKDPKTWEENGRVRTLLMYVEDKLYARLELEDTILPQYFALPEDDIKVLNGGRLEARFEIAEVYPGSVYEDTCLTGLIMEFSGRYAH